MTYIKRIFFFLLTNLAVMILLSVVMGIIGYFFPNIIHSKNDFIQILIYAIIIGFFGSFISLWISRWSAKRTYGIILLESRNTISDNKLQLVWDTVERIAQMNNIRMPEVGYYESQDPNAFATGATKNSSLVAVSAGLLNQMERNEIEGVIGHEMAHILNGDMVTLTLLQGVMNTFVILLSHIAAKFVASFLERDKENALSYFAYQAIYMVFQIVFGFLAMFVIMWFSRIREYRADLGGAKFTEKGKMIAGLKKLKSLSSIQREGTKNTQMNAFMITEKDSFFSTHPSLDNRIKALEENYQHI